MYTSIFQVTNNESNPIWCKNEKGDEAPMRHLMLEDITENPRVEEVMCCVYGHDALKSYGFGDLVLATLKIFVCINEDETYEQEIRVTEIKKIILPKP